MEYQSEKGKNFIDRAVKLANVLEISIQEAIKKLHAEAANKMFESDENLKKWEKENFPKKEDD